MNDLIGVFDSGIGGVSVLQRLAARYNDYEFVYCGDNDYAPYGDKPQEYILNRAKECVKILQKCGCKVIVVACNTVSLVCGEKLALAFPDIKFVFMKPYFTEKHAKGIIFCTVATGKILLEKGLATKKQVYPLPDMAKLIEDGYPDIDYHDFICRLNCGFNYNNVILGCTHYVFLKNYFKRAFPFAEIDDCIDRAINDLNQILIKKGNADFILYNNYIEDNTRTVCSKKDETNDKNEINTYNVCRKDDRITNMTKIDNMDKTDADTVLSRNGDSDNKNNGETAINTRTVWSKIDKNGCETQKNDKIKGEPTTEGQNKANFALNGKKRENIWFIGANADKNEKALGLLKVTKSQ